MQRLEVSCAVRLIYMSLGAKGLKSEKLPHYDVRQAAFISVDGMGGGGFLDDRQEIRRILWIPKVQRPVHKSPQPGCVTLPSVRSS